MPKKEKAEEVVLENIGLIDRQTISAQEFEEFVKDDNVAEKCMADINQIKTTELSGFDRSKISEAKRFYNYCKAQEAQVDESDRAIIWRLGRIHPKGIKGPGIVRYYKDIDEIEIMSLREKCFNLSDIEMLTLDMVAIRVDLVVYYKVKVPVRAKICVIDYLQATKLLCTSLFRDAIGCHTYDELRFEKNKVKSKMMNEITYATIVWGVLVTRVEIEDMKFMKKIEYKIPDNYISSLRDEPKVEESSKKKSKKAKIKKTTKTEEIEVEVD